MSKQPVVIYHADCWDGFCAAWLFYKVFPDAEFHAAHYGTNPPALDGRRVFLVDFSYPRSLMLALSKETPYPVTVLDHHKTAQQELEGIERETLRINAFDIFFNMEKSGGRLAWEYLLKMALLPEDMVPASGKIADSPWLVSYTEDRDLWRWQLPQSREINAALRSYPLDFATWDQLASRDKYALVLEGRSILRREQQIVADHVRNAGEMELDGHKVLAVNATVLISEIAGELSRDRPFGVCYFDRKDGKRVYSLRSRGDFDVSEIARRHGGGGHKNAAGFEVNP